MEPIWVLHRESQFKSSIVTSHCETIYHTNQFLVAAKDLFLKWASCLDDMQDFAVGAARGTTGTYCKMHDVFCIVVSVGWRWDRKNLLGGFGNLRLLVFECALLASALESMPRFVSHVLYSFHFYQ